MSASVTVVSIHAPAKGRRDARERRSDRVERFNPRPREGATARPARRVTRQASFNPRPREGATSDG